MYDEVLFHGTKIERGRKILELGKMIPSYGDRHWLGDGGYLYHDDFYAYKWIRDMYKAQKAEDSEPEVDLFDRYRIIKIRVNTKIDRVFDLDKPENKIQFDCVYDQCNMAKVFSEKFKDKEFVDGVVLNIMFNNLDYGKDYDIVIATFVKRSNKYTKIPIRRNYIFEKQICVKNLSVATPIGFYNCNDKIPIFENLIDNLYDIKHRDKLKDEDEKIILYSTKRNERINKKRIKKNK